MLLRRWKNMRLLQRMSSFFKSYFIFGVFISVFCGKYKWKSIKKIKSKFSMLKISQGCHLKHGDFLFVCWQQQKKEVKFKWIQILCTGLKWAKKVIVKVLLGKKQHFSTQNQLKWIRVKFESPFFLFPRI